MADITQKAYKELSDLINQDDVFVFVNKVHNMSLPDLEHLYSIIHIVLEDANLLHVAVVETIERRKKMN